MTDLDVRLRLRADGTNLVSVVRGAKGDVRELGTVSVEAGAQATSGLARAEAAADRLQRTLRNAATVAAGAFGVASIAQVATALVRVADSAANAEAKLRLATESEQQYAAARAETFAISQRTSTELNATITLYGRLTAALRDLKVPQSDVAALTETINQTLAISGATGAEAASAVLQLSQAFGKGKLDSEEFNTVAEAAPRIMQALADSLGVPRGQLKALAEEGKLTAEVLVNALSGTNAEKIASEFEKIPVTIERAWTQVRNATQRAIGDLDRSVGASSGIAQSLVSLSNNLNLVVDALGALGVAAVAGAGAKLTTSFVAATTAALAKRQAVVAAASADQAAALASAEHAAAQAREVTATLAAVQAARADAVATLQTAQTKVQAAQATIAATSAIGAQSAAIRANAVAQEQLTVAIAQRTAATTALATLGRQQAALEAQLAAAATAQVAANNAVAASQTRLAASSSAAAAATGVLSRAGGALFTMIGGWPTIAAGAAAAIYFLVTSIDRSAEAAEAAVQKAREERERWQQEAVEQRRQQRAENPELIFSDITRMERRIQEIRRLGGADGPSESGARLLATLTKDLKDLRQEYAEATGDVSRFSTTLSGQREEIGKFIERLKQQVQSQREQIAASEGGAAAVAVLQRNQLAAAAATDEQKAQIQSLIGVIGQNDAAIKKITDSKRAERDVQKELNEQLAINRALEAQKDEEDRKAEQRRIDRENATIAARAQMQGLQADLRTEAELIEMSAAEREIAVAVLQEEDRWRSVLAAAQSGTIDLTEAEVLAERELAKEKAKTNAERAREKRIREQLGTFGGRVDPDTGQVQAFNTLPELIGGAIAEAMTDGAQGFGRVMQRWSDAWDQARERGGAAQTSFVADTITQVADFASNVIGAFERNADAPLRAIAEVAAMIPGPVGDVARAVQAIDSLFGGRLLGTNYEVQRQGRNVAFGASGVQGSTFVTETRQRSLFRGTARRTTTTALDAEAQAQLTAFFDQVAAAVGQAARALGAEVPALVAGAFREEFDKNGKLISQVSTVAGRSYTESFQQFQQRLTAESLLLVVGQFDSAVQQIAERWRADAAKLLDGAQFLLQAQAAIQQGEALLGEGSTLTETADFVQGFARAGETLTQTFTRLQVSSKLLTEATDLMGVALDLSREEFIRFAADITDAAGGVERAAQLWQGYFETFYSAEERAARSVATSGTRRTEELADIGLAPDISMAEFRALFEEALPTLSAEAVVEWLEAADAIRQANAAQRAYAEALRAEADFLRDIGNAILEQDGSEFDQTLARIRDQTAGYIEQANALARSRGQEAASARDLAMIHRWAANEVRRAIEQLRGQARDIITQLGYNDLDAQIAELEGRSNGLYQSQVDGLNDVADAAANAFEEMQSAIADLNDYLEDMLLGDLSPLSPEEQLDEAQRRLNQTAARALQGDASAVQQLPQLADAYLRLVRDRDASGADYRAEFERVRGLLQSVAGMDTGVAPPRDIQLVPSEELRALYAQRDAQAAEEEAQRRLALASDLATYLRDLAAATNESLFGVAERLGVDFGRFVTDLGGQAEASTAEAVAGLASIANQLNVELSDLGEELGLALGELADENSLLNDAFELALAGLPAEFREQLEPALQDVENAADQEEAAAALERLEDLTDALPEEFRLRLAPYLANIDQAPFQALNQLGLLSAVDANTAQAVTLLEQILVAVGGELSDEDAPATASGKALLSNPLDFVPTKLRDEFREGNQVLVDELAALRREVEQLRREARENSREEREAAGNGAERTASAIAGAIDRQTAELTIRRVAS